MNYQEEDLKYGLWKTIESRTFPGSVSNHHLGTQLGMLMAAYEMNQFRDVYQKAVIDNAKSFARSLKAHGLDVAGDPSIGYTETHQVIVSVGYGEGPGHRRAAGAEQHRGELSGHPPTRRASPPPARCVWASAR